MKDHKLVDIGSEYSKKDPSTVKLYLSDFKGIKEMTIGQEVKLEITAKVVSVSTDEWGMNGKNTTCARLDAVSVTGDTDNDD